MTKLTPTVCVSLLLLSSFACEEADPAAPPQTGTGGSTIIATTAPKATGGSVSASSGGASATSEATTTAPGGSTAQASGGATSASSAKTAAGGSIGAYTSTSTLPATGGTMSDTETPVAVHGQLKVVGTQLVDKSGTPVQLKGPSSMWLNWETTGYASNVEGLTHLRNNWKMSVIRAAMGVEPSGAYLANPTKAKAAVDAVVQAAVKLGVYVIIDWHDHADPPRATQTDEAVAFFKEMATLYKDLPNVIYETYNEPLKVSWTDVLKPYHTAVVEAIRDIDTDSVIILGTPQWSQRVDQAAADPLDPVKYPNLMYTLHFYSCTHTAAVRNYGVKALGLGLPIFVTEWGATDANGGKPETPDLCIPSADAWFKWMNDNKISWAAWKLDDCADTTCYFKPKTPATGPFTDDTLWGHASYVRDRMRE